MGRVVSVGVSAISPTVFSQMVQVPLYKRLVALEICNTRFSDSVGVAVKIPRYTDLSAQTYTPGTPVSATNLTWAFDTLNLSTYKHVTFYINNLCTLEVTPSIKFHKLLETPYWDNQQRNLVKGTFNDYNWNILLDKRTINA